jgi:transcriptional regulator with XRE-family HTH domain
VEPDRLSRELADKLEAARMTAEALSLDAQLARDTVGRWIRGTTVPTLAALRAVENVLSGRLGYSVDLAAAVRERRSAQQRHRQPRRGRAEGHASGPHGEMTPTLADPMRGPQAGRPGGLVAVAERTVRLRAELSATDHVVKVRTQTGELFESPFGNLTSALGLCGCGTRRTVAIDLGDNQNSGTGWIGWATRLPQL